MEPKLHFNLMDELEKRLGSARKQKKILDAIATLSDAVSMTRFNQVELAQTLGDVRKSVSKIQEQVSELRSAMFSTVARRRTGITLHVSKDVKRQISDAASARGITVASHMRESLRQYITDPDPPVLPPADRLALRGNRESVTLTTGDIPLAVFESFTEFALKHGLSKTDLMRSILEYAPICPFLDEEAHNGRRTSDENN